MSEETRVDVLPDLSTLPPVVRNYIETLQAENRSLRAELEQTRGRPRRAASVEGSRAAVSAPVRERTTAADVEPESLPTVPYAPSTMVISISSQGLAKRTPVNSYGKQRRGGLGVFDIKLRDEDPVAYLLVADESDTLLIVTSRCRTYRVPVGQIRLGDVRERGEALSERVRLTDGETISALVAVNDADESGLPWVVMGSASGVLRRMRRNYVGPNLADGTILYDPKEGGPPVVLTLSRGEGDLFLSSNSGMAIRFEEKLVTHRGTRGMRLSPAERLVGVAPVPPGGAVLLITRDGLGVRRTMDTFAASKSVGGQGKIAVKTDGLVAGLPVSERDEVLCVSGFAKIIRFDAAGVPPRSSPAQGVAVMDLRGDQVVAATVITPPL